MNYRDDSGYRAGTCAAVIMNRIGMLEPGKLADVIAVPGDPTQDIRRTSTVKCVMKEGKV